MIMMIKFNKILKQFLIYFQIVLNAWNDLIDGLMNHLPDTNFRFYNVSVKEYNQTKFLEFTVLSSMEPDEMSSQLS